MFFLYSSNSMSQESIKGTILSNNGKQVPYATIKCNSGVFFSDSSGVFNLVIKSKEEVFAFSCVGFQGLSISYEELLKKSQVELIEINYKLNEVIVSSNNKDNVVENLGNDKVGVARFLPKPGFQYALYISNEKGKNGIIQSVSYFIRKPPGGDASGPFRVRLYTVDSISKEPDKDLLNVNLIVHGIKDWAWLTVDLKKYNLKFPKLGFFVAMETLPISDYKKGDLKRNDIYKNAYNLPGLGYTTTKKTNHSWMFWPSTKNLRDRWTKWENDNFSIKSKIMFFE